jgi:hypothetical protein
MLTEKQQMVVDLVQEGRSPKYIARKLKTSVRVAKTYITKLSRQGSLPNGQHMCPEYAPEPTPACTPAAVSAIQPSAQFDEGLTRLVLGATVQYLRMVGGAEQAHKLINEVRNSITD